MTTLIVKKLIKKNCYAVLKSAILFLAFCLFTFAGYSQSDPKTNIVFIFADDLGFMDISYNHSDYYETPNLDKFSRENLVFSNAYSGGSNCAPSRGALLTGLYSPRTGMYAVGSTTRGPLKEMRLTPVPNNQHLPANVHTMADALKSAGYVTGIFGKWHVGAKEDKTDPANMGFDVVMDNPIMASLYSPNPMKQASEKIVTDPKAMFEIADSAISFIKANKNKPFFAYISHHAIHSPHQTRAETFKRFQAKTPGQYNKNPAIAGSIYDFDKSLAKVLDCLKQTGLDKNTMVVITSDNGGTTNSIQEPLRGNKGSFYEGGIRVPFIVRWPGKTKPGINNTPIINLDLYPTFAALAGAKIPAFKVLDGENLLPIFRGQKTATSRNKLFWHFPGYLNGPVTRGREVKFFRTRPVTAMRRGDYKILLYHEEWVLDGGFSKRNTNNSIELYNLKTDPGEHENIASADPKKRDELLKDLLSWMKETNAKMATISTPEEELLKKLPEEKKDLYDN